MPRVEGMPDHFMCKDCRTIKHNNDYYKDRSTRRGYSDRCKLCSRAHVKAYKKKNWRKYLDKQMERTQILKKQVYDQLGWSCACCGETEVEFLVVDHVRGDGAQDRKNKGTVGGHVFYMSIKKEGFPKDKYQILCHNCNWSKGPGLGSLCIHQRNKNKVL